MFDPEAKYQEIVDLLKQSIADNKIIVETINRSIDYNHGNAAERFAMVEENVEKFDLDSKEMYTKVDTRVDNLVS